MEGKQGSQYAKAYEDEGKEHLLYVNRNVVHGSNLVDVHCGGAAEVVDAQYAENQERRAPHQHQRQLHGSILLVARPPHAYQQIHGDECHLVEHEHGEHIGADEEAIHTRREQGEPQEILLGHGLQLPRGKGTSKDDDAR